jgi:hypothetical protein
MQKSKFTAGFLSRKQYAAIAANTFIPKYCCPVKLKYPINPYGIAFI